LGAWERARLRRLGAAAGGAEPTPGECGLAARSALAQATAGAGRLGVRGSRCGARAGGMEVRGGEPAQGGSGGAGLWLAGASAGKQRRNAVRMVQQALGWNRRGAGARVEQQRGQARMVAA
jgi:hypothetical protein